MRLCKYITAIIAVATVWIVAVTERGQAGAWAKFGLSIGFVWLVGLIIAIKREEREKSECHTLKHVQTAEQILTQEKNVIAGAGMKSSTVK